MEPLRPIQEILFVRCRGALFAGLFHRARLPLFPTSLTCWLVPQPTGHAEECSPRDFLEKLVPGCVHSQDLRRAFCCVNVGHEIPLNRAKAPQNAPEQGKIPQIPQNSPLDDGRMKPRRRGGSLDFCLTIPPGS